MRGERGKVGEGRSVGGMEEAFVVSRDEDIVMPEEGNVVALEGWLWQEGGNELVKGHGDEANIIYVMGVCNNRELVHDGRVWIGGRDNEVEGD